MCKPHEDQEEREVPAADQVELRRRVALAERRYRLRQQIREEVEAITDPFHLTLLGAFLHLLRDVRAARQGRR